MSRKCKYCCDEKPHFVKVDCTNEINLSNKEILAFCGWCGSYTKVKIKYCPMCGRKLGVENDKSRNV